MKWVHIYYTLCGRFRKKKRKGSTEGVWLSNGVTQHVNPSENHTPPQEDLRWIFHRGEILSGCDNFLFSWLPGRASLTIKLLAQMCLNNKTVCVKLKSQNMLMVCTVQGANTRIQPKIKKYKSIGMTISVNIYCKSSTCTSKYSHVQNPVLMKIWQLHCQGNINLKTEHLRCQIK